MKILDKMQRRVAIWILGAFKTSLSEGIEAITGIIPIRFHLQKIARRLLICPFKLSTNHILRNLMDDLPPLPNIVRIAEGGLNCYFSFSFLFYFLFYFRSIFYF